MSVLRNIWIATRNWLVDHHLALTTVAVLSVLFVISLLINPTAKFAPFADNNAAAPAASEQPAPSESAAAAPAFTYDDEWTLLDLQRHLAAGDVLAISTAPGDPNAASTTPYAPRTRSNASAPRLSALLTNGQVVSVVTELSAADAVEVLSTLGYAGLLTEEITDPVAAQPVNEAPAGLGSTTSFLVGLAMLGGLIGLVVWNTRRNQPSKGDDPVEKPREESHGHFTTLRPAVIGPAKEDKAANDEAGDLETSASEDVAAIPDGVRFADVAGCEEAKLELTETIEFLRDPERFARLGAKIPRGVMLYGPPGTGKTMLAKAAATEAGVSFIFASASSFVEMYVGVGAKRVRELFASARAEERAIVFIDEFDAIGRARGTASSHEEREQTLNEILVQMDGFSTTDQIVVIGATNRHDILDPAVLRPGRFTRKVHVPLPDVEGRRRILEVHAAGKPMADDVDLGAIATKTYGMSGAELADLLNEAAIFAARDGSEQITRANLHDGWLKVIAGTSRHRSMDPRERSIIAAHEVGHAICGHVHGDRRRVEEITLFAHGNALGLTASSQTDNDLPSERDLRASLIALLGGRAAEELLFEDVTGGAGNDFEKANQLARQMVTVWGMGIDPLEGRTGTTGRGKLSFLVSGEQHELPAELQAAQARAMAHILDECYTIAKQTLLDHLKLLRRISAYLVRHERMSGEVLYALLADEVPPAEEPDPNEEWRPITTRPRAWNEIPAYAAMAAPMAASPAESPAPAQSISAPRPPTRRRRASAVGMLLRILRPRRP